ncbi:ras-related protein Rab-5C [Histomonas meleagridis]|uniref:ras-related protein Rab-5C n=1 Tax=Histomonas meleagridis TaxID=135588 RepID=UPI00355AC709|nr:ras-related protein Rab-5C [Histomonas meleagridis]KAH0797606.1 ras-related protein Rab-5C [Histomonas meleagridis]
MTKSPEYKVIIVGDSAVGKTSIVMRYHRDTYFDDHQATVGASFITKSIETKNGKININIWDTAGQEKYRSLVPMYSRNASAAIIVFDLSDPTSFENMKFWLDEVRQNVPNDCIIVIVGNKNDLPIAIPKDEAFAWAKSNNLQMVFVSAKEGIGINELFQTVAELISTSKRIRPITELEPIESNGNKCC